MNKKANYLWSFSSAKEDLLLGLRAILFFFFHGFQHLFPYRYGFFKNKKNYLFLARKIHHAQISPFPRTLFYSQDDNSLRELSIAVKNALKVNYN